MKNTTRGGLRNPPGGRPTKPDKRTTLSVCLTPENAQYLAAMGRGKNDFLNRILDLERKTEKTEWIDVKERLPEPGDSVLTFPHFKVLPFGNSENDGLSYDWSDSDFWTFENDKVVEVRPYPTYWMPLPPMPNVTV